MIFQWFKTKARLGFCHQLLLKRLRVSGKRKTKKQETLFAQTLFEVLSKV